MVLHDLFAPALAQITAKWATLPQATKDALAISLPDLTERHTFLDWNARLSATEPKFLVPCQATYAAVMAWDSLSVIERLTVAQAGMGPISAAAANRGLVGGVPARAVS